MCKGVNKKINEVCKIYQYFAEPSKKLIKNSFSINKKTSKIYYKKEVVKRMEKQEIEQNIISLINTVNTVDDRVVYCPEISCIGGN